MNDLRVYLEQEISTRRAMRKHANLAKMLDAGKAFGKQTINVAKANPTAAGAVIGAGAGAATAGEGNRLKGALIGGTVGAGAGKLTQKPARDAVMQYAREKAPVVGAKVGEGTAFVGSKVKKAGEKLRDFSNNKIMEQMIQP